MHVSHYSLCNPRDPGSSHVPGSEMTCQSVQPLPPVFLGVPAYFVLHECLSVEAVYLDTVFAARAFCGAAGFAL